jgi:glucan phosphoethanolaminetransferase (alkaline phosphatase superfamily)
MGSHFDYSNKSDEIDKKHIKGDDKISRFNRSIHHTDRVLKEIYHIMNQNDTSSIFYYISDHGQNLETLGHGFLDNNVSQFEVPMIFINQTKVNVDSIVNKYYQHNNDWINTLCSINVLAEIMGYSFSDEFVNHVREQGKYIYHVDSQVYKYEDLERTKNED